MKQTVSKTFHENIFHFLKTNGISLKNSSIIVAVSGGIDSVVLLHFLAKNKQKFNISLAVAHVNYHLRGIESNKDQKFVQNLAKKYKIPFYFKEIDANNEAKKNHQNLQDFARNFRYDFFNSLRKTLNFEYIATAHNANDNAETVLQNVFRGTGISGLAGIPVFRSNVRVLRPFLSVSREDIKKYAQQNKLHWREDSSNKNEKYKRNFIRKSLIPQIERKINPAIIQTLNSEAVTFKKLSEFVTEIVEKEFSQCVKETNNEIHLSLSRFNSVHRFLAEMIILRILKTLELEPTSIAIQSIIELSQNQSGKKIELSKKWTAVKSAAEIIFHQHLDRTQFSYILKKEGRIRTKEFVFSIQKSAPPKKISAPNAFTEFVDAATVEFPVTIRSWKEGDSFVPLGMNAQKKLSDFFIDKKISLNEKHNVPIIESSNKIIWIAGLRLDDRCKITEQTKKVYKFTLEKI